MALSAVRSFAFATLVAATLGACSGDYNVGKVRMIEPVDGFYYSALQQGYADVAQWKQDERNWDESEILLGKARAAAAGTIPALEPAPTPELEEARNKLTAALARLDETQYAVDAALARVSYDCLALTSVDKPPHPDGVGSHDCKMTFTESLAALEGLAAMPQEPVSLHFDHKQVTLSGAAQKAVQDLADTVVKLRPSMVLISGYSDPSKRLSDEIIVTQKRVTAVQKALEEAGVAAVRIKQMVYDDQGTAPKAGGDDGSNGGLKQVTITLVR
jgi:outer membrane protein OmpA-like peptidoglycan-associated protein